MALVKETGRKVTTNFDFQDTDLKDGLIRTNIIDVCENYANNFSGNTKVANIVFEKQKEYQPIR